MRVTKQVYVANCIENGEEFISLFQTNETNKQKLYSFGQEHASQWGGECINISKYKGEIPTDVWDNDLPNDTNLSSVVLKNV